MRRWAVSVLLAFVLAGCGVGAGSASAPTKVVTVVSRDFGAKQIRRFSIKQIPPAETILRLLERHFAITTRYGGGFVQSIEGLSGGKDAQGRPVDWFYYVNGIESGQGAAARKVYPGDVVWWDRHDWGAAQRVPAVVGSWPQPFLSGSEGRRIPIALQCAGDERSCDEVSKRLNNEGVTQIARTGIGAGVGQKLLRIVVGRWDRIRTDPAVRELEKGPTASGVYAKPGTNGFQLLDESGKVADTPRGSVGLVAATRFGAQEPTWVVTGTDDAGVAAAAASLRTDVLDNRFAVAVIDGRGEPLPIRLAP